MPRAANPFKVLESFGDSAYKVKSQKEGEDDTGVSEWVGSRSSGGLCWVVRQWRRLVIGDGGGASEKVLGDCGGASEKVLGGGGGRR
ncbi:hypothetical protein Tco_1004248 [Tanacetum coccineum]|uniref:Uncharacterized protein n=1 Tax=Tanacetum coccineum TaxID=301880 RepID=A0ABQ5FBK2_9ASTR